MIECKRNKAERGDKNEQRYASTNPVLGFIYDKLV